MLDRGLEAEHLAKRFGRSPALTDLSLRAQRGAITALIGPNGAGKSTTFGILAGLLRPDAGRITLDGRPLGPDRGRSIALIAETPEVYPLLTVWEHLVFAAKLARLGAGWEMRANALLERFSLGDQRDKLGAELSKGMRQKTLIAATVLVETPVLLLDEPMVGLDPLGQRELRDVLDELRQRDACIIISTHVLAAAETLCDRVVVINGGRDIASGSVEEIRALGEGDLEAVFLAITAT